MGEGLIGSLVMIDKNGNENRIGNVIVKEITRDSNEISETDELKEFTVCPNSYTVSFGIKTITRKKFIKMLMARGIARNGAKDIADYIHRKYGYYDINILLYL